MQGIKRVPTLAQDARRRPASGPCTGVEAEGSLARHRAGLGCQPAGALETFTKAPESIFDGFLVWGEALASKSILGRFCG